MYDIPSDPSIESVTITKDCIESGTAPKIVRAADDTSEAEPDSKELPIETLDLGTAEIS